MMATQESLSTTGNRMPFATYLAPTGCSYARHFHPIFNIQFNRQNMTAGVGTERHSPKKLKVIMPRTTMNAWYMCHCSVQSAAENT